MDSKFIFACSFISKHLGEPVSVGTSPYTLAVWMGNTVLINASKFTDIVRLVAEKEHEDDKHPKTVVYVNGIAQDIQSVYSIMGYCKYHEIECRYISEKKGV